jgi:Tol biopolymer transport system component
MTPQESIAHYRIVSKLGEGGMGVVYRATDTKLNRDVAIKVLPEAFANDPNRLARFTREAQVLASLNHPNIAMIFGVEDRALVMELVEGENLKSPLPVESAIAYAKQIAEALEAAHEKGIIHRDLKPANIKVTPQGTIKVLDFGLAAVTQGNAVVSGNSQNSPTLTLMGATQAGLILGTAAYMSPEQAEGKQVDKRADIWSFGVVLWEMLTGQQLFAAESVSHTLADVLRAPIDFSALPKDTPLAIRTLLARCLDRNVQTRLRDIGEARIALASPRDLQLTQQQAPRRFCLPWAIAAFGIAAAGVMAFVHFREMPPETAAIRALITPPPNTAFFTSDTIGMIALPTLSPDGRRMVFGVRDQDGRTRLWVRALDSTSAQPLAGTEGGLHPFWSPDSKFIAFFADSNLKKIDASGGPVFTLWQNINNIGRGGTWNRDGVILFAVGGNGVIFRLAASGGSPVQVTDRGEFPCFLPDGRHFIFHRDSAVYVGSLDSKMAARLVDTESQANYFGGYLVYIREDVLMAQAFDIGKLAVSGDPVPLVQDVRMGTPRIGVFSLSQTGMLAYQEGQRRLRLSWFDRNGQRLEDAGEAAGITSFQLSPDGKTVAAAVLTKGSSDLWLFDITRRLKSRFTFLNSTGGIEEVWSPDGSSLVFYGRKSGEPTLTRKNVDTGEEQVLRSGDTSLPTGWTPNGKTLLYDLATPGAGRDTIMVLPFVDLKPTPFATPHASHGTISPDGRWVAYDRQDAGGRNVFVAPFPGPGRTFQVSPLGGSLPRWRGDGKELFYLANNQLMAAKIDTHGQSLEVGRVQPLFGGLATVRYDVSRDGRRVLLAVPAPESNSDPLTLVENWTALLKK